MKVAVMGAGAVGCYFGARLHQAGHEVVLIGRPALAEAVNREGLRLQTRDADTRLPLRAATTPEAARGAELVLFCVKSGDTESAGASLRPFLDPGATVLCLQNGVDNAARLTPVLQWEAVPVAVYVAVEMGGPGHVIHHGRGELILGPAAGSEAAAQAFAAAGIPASVTPAVMDALWTKLTVNCAYNALSALTQLPYGELLQRPGMPETVRALVEECQVVARAAGISLPASIWEDTLTVGRTMAAQRSSTAQDLARGRRTEIDFINGYVVREADRLGVSAPVNRALQALVKAREDEVAGRATR